MRLLTWTKYTRVTFVDVLTNAKRKGRLRVMTMKRLSSVSRPSQRVHSPAAGPGELEDTEE
jgi:hypothetical protein